MIRKIIGILLAAAVLLDSGCRPFDQRTAAEITMAADSELTKPVAVVGYVDHIVASASLIHRYVYQLRDRTGTILVVSDSAAPCPGTSVVVRGPVKRHDLLGLGVLRLGPVLWEDGRRVRASADRHGLDPLVCAENPRER